MSTHSFPRPLSTEIKLDRYAGGARVSVTGEFDLALKEEFAECIQKLRQVQGQVLLDLGEVSFIDSTGLRMVLELWIESRKDGFDLAILPTSEAVRRALDLTGLDRELPIMDGDLPLQGDSLNGGPTEAKT
jgi:anti-anti-sigma factor